MTTKNANEPHDAKLSKLQERERKLRIEALQLRARAEHLKRVQLTHAKRLARKIDAHEKIVLGALVKKAGLDKYLLPDTVVSANQENDNDMNALGLRILDSSAKYDRELILGALLWLATALNQRDNTVVRIPDHHRLKEQGKAFGANSITARF